MAEPVERNLGLDLVRVTETAGLGMKEKRQSRGTPGWIQEKVIATDDLVGSANVFFAATGVTTGEYLRGVDFSADVAVTHSVIMRSKTGSIRYMDAHHNLAKLRDIAAVVLD